jgi:hypothetical protein
VTWFRRIDRDRITPQDVQTMIDRAELCRRFAKGEKSEFLFFGGHQPANDGEITASWLILSPELHETVRRRLFTDAPNNESR